MIHPSRQMLKLKDVNRAEGIMLEGMPFTDYGAQPGIALVHKDWENIYFVKERADWSEEDYFDFADKRFAELIILKP